MTQIKLPLRSVSQINQYTKCPMAYKLARIDKVWQRPAAWLPQGTAFHAVAEAVEVWESYGMPLTLDEAKDMFRWHYANDVGAFTEETPNFEWWTWSGPYNGQRDIERRYTVGLEQVEKFFAWRETPGQEIWVTPDGTPAIELYFEIELDGILVRGYIDAVVVVDGELRVRDYKTGNQPGDDFQLGVYALAVAMTYGVEAPKTGDYFMVGKKGKAPKPTKPYDLTKWTREAITEEFHRVEEGIAASMFDPLPEPDKCKFCDVSYSCPVFK
ncbi:Cas4 exonuclease [Mycobacterium phage Kerberos]|uniref:exonuclease n=1 Tax=Mycobacterium phage Chy5 TaxID=1327948 RepID=UPI00032B91FB|nr:exonuclease [Mycobacterium phage Chy5]YP_008060229.1 exonuclease [Mycobacterium phage Chy4]AOQ27908.1 Cas4 exonuclease [Mycobacterium phage Pomar16]APC43124.1 Cas4 exonuclease [Mycobacterium phage Kerberos]APC46192.1 Cas4 exonuclease [Mycobacterium phage StarStuff]AXH48937.1 Cas4 exonuclease [Mycobacterium phage Tomathan]QBP28734.1 Cas4 exonuclease [Mycobacterium phage DBQu4n]UXE05490.1 Cas4 exonuclease [Mycobacterium phage Duplo]